MKSGYCITTKQFILRCKHPEWLKETQKLYNEVLLFYYQLLLRHTELHSLNGQQTMRELEILSIPGRDKVPVPEPLPAGKVPLYFRRSAINSAVAMVKSYLSRQEQEEPTKEFHKPVTFYKGMYRDLTEREITLKLWTGEKWQWMRCRLNGNHLPQDGEILSPMVVVHEKECYLNVPVKEEVRDVRKASERIRQNTRICSVKFSNQDAVAICGILDEAGKLVNSYYIKGGSQYRHLCTQIQEKMDKSRKSIGAQKESQPNKKYWVKLKNVSDYFSNSISRQIIDISIKEGAGIITLAKYNKEYSMGVLSNTGKWSPLALSTRIREQLKYKAWGQGILVLEVNPKDTANRCSRCGGKIQNKGSEYLCENGHRGERHLNSAVLLGRKCIESFRKQDVE